MLLHPYFRRPCNQVLKMVVSEFSDSCCSNCKSFNGYRFGSYRYMSMRYRASKLLIDEEREQLEADCKTLGITIQSDEQQLRDAYVKLAKMYHPDGGSADADAVKFSEVDKAYKNMLRKFADERHNLHKVEGEYGLNYDQKKADQKQQEVELEVDEDDDENGKHVAPQHRQYLSYGGYGAGSPFQREKQYQKYRAAKAADNVLDHRIKQVSNKSFNADDKAVMQNTKAARKIKTSFGMDRLVEDMIQESMAKGEFDNLSCMGKPLKNEADSNPYIDFTTHKLNQVLIDNGFAPEWIMLEKEIRQEIRDLRDRLKRERHSFPETLNATEDSKWDVYVQGLQTECDVLNKKIFKYNLVVPSMHKQIISFQLDCEAARAREAFDLKFHETVKQEVKKREAAKAKNVHTPFASSTGPGFIDGLFSFLTKAK